MKTRLSKVYKKLPNQKVSLSSISELERAADTLTVDSNNFKEIDEGFSKANQYFQSLESAISKAQEFVDLYDLIYVTYSGVLSDNEQQIQNVLNEFERNAELLGVNARDIEAFYDLEAQLEDVKNLQAKWEDFVFVYEDIVEQARLIVDFRVSRR